MTSVASDVSVRVRARAEAVEQATPAERDRVVDLLRAVAIGAVVLGHWLVTALFVRNGQLGGQSVLALVPATRWATWLFQVMPVFFLVGGYANAVSWNNHRGRGGDWTSWLYRRSARMLTPTTVFVVAVTAGVLAGRLGGMDEGLLRQAAWLVGISLWFLAVYVGVVALAPLLLAAHRRWGLWWLAGMVAIAAVLDSARLATSAPVVAAANFVIVWAAIHQLGFGWRDGRLTRPRWLPWMLAGGGLGVLVVLTVAGPYPVSMVSVPGAPIQNTSPPSMALLALGVAQTGVILLLRAPLGRWVERPSVWLGVVTVNGVVLTLFLWHFVPVVVAGPALYLTGVMPDAPIGTPAWFALRVVWVAVLAALLVPVVAALGRFERTPARAEAARDSRGNLLTTVLAASGVLLVCLGLLVLTTGGFATPGVAGIPVVGLGLYAAGLLSLGVVGRLTRRSLPSS